MKKIFNAIFSLHYLAIFAVIGPFFGAVLMLILGSKNTIDAYLLFFGLQEPEGAVTGSEAAMIQLVASIDHFLFAAILMIFAVGLYSLFFRTSSKSRQQDARSKKLSWKKLRNMGGMDEMLLKVIIMLLAVSFLEYTLTAGIDTLTWQALVIPLTIIALAAGLKLMSSAEEDDLLEEKSVEKRDRPNGT